MLGAGAAVVLIGKGKTEARSSALGYTDTPVLPGQKWRVHDIERPHPPMVTPPQVTWSAAPSDAIVLFDGKDLSQWATRGRDGSLREPGWTVKDGYMEIGRKTGDIITREKFGDCQLHIEWMVPPGSPDSGQWRGNSGVMLMGRYEIQVLESFDNPTYADGQAAAIYGQYPPLVNASRKPGEWQSYDIFFETPRFEGEKLVKPAYVTVVHNGIMVHHRQEIVGPVAHRAINQYKPHDAEEPLLLQDHDATVRFRNIWIRRLKGYDQQ
ncbi:MAG: DUF1080 domain-containing protein [Bryobacteraceae bacterium]